MPDSLPNDHLHTLMYNLSVSGVAWSGMPPPQYDPDAQAYIASQNITELSAKNDINAWIVGLKSSSINYWESLLDVMTFRSSQAIGTGTAVTGMKGVMTGILTNGPTWGSDGIAFDGVNDTIVLSGASQVFQNVGAGYLVSVLQDTNPNGGSTTHIPVFWSTSSATLTKASFQTRSSGVQQTVTNGRRLDADTGVGSVLAGVSGSRAYLESWQDWSGGNLTLVVDGSEQPPAAYSSGAGMTSNTASAQHRLGGTGSAGLYFPGVISMVMVSNVMPSPEVAELVRSLYKNTIGKGLGLP